MSSKNQHGHSDFYLFDDALKKPDFISKSEDIGIYVDTCESDCEKCYGMTMCRFLDFVGTSGKTIIQKSLNQEDFSLDGDINFKFDSIGENKKFTFYYLINYRYAHEQNEYFFRIAFRSKEKYLKVKKFFDSSTTDAKNHV